VQEAEKRLASAQAGLEAARAALSQLTLAAPFAGTITAVSPRPGEWVYAWDAGDDAGQPGQPAH
jgi:multidrug resistance efflux pump